MVMVWRSSAMQFKQSWKYDLFPDFRYKLLLGPIAYLIVLKWIMPIYLLQDSLVPIEAFVPYDKGELLSDIHKVGMVEKTVSIMLDH